MQLHCPQLRDKLKNIKALYSAYCLELEQAKNSKEYEKALSIQLKLIKVIFEFGVELNPGKYIEAYITEIERKNKANIPLSRAEIVFLYDTEYTLPNYYKSSALYASARLNIKGCLGIRSDIKADLSLATGYPKQQISISQEEALAGNIKFHYGDLELPNLTSAEGLQLPENVFGNLYLGKVTSTEGLILPKSVGGSLFLDRLRSAEGLKLPDSIGGDLWLRGLLQRKGLKLPDNFCGMLRLLTITGTEAVELKKQSNGCFKIMCEY
jgi:hypothetical protein